MRCPIGVGVFRVSCSALLVLHVSVLMGAARATVSTRSRSVDHQGKVVRVAAVGVDPDSCYLGGHHSIYLSPLHKTVTIIQNCHHYY